MKKILYRYRHLVIDVVAAAVLLCTFALFHHVLPSPLPGPDVPIIENDGVSSSLSAMEQTFQEHLHFAPITDENSYVSKNVIIETSTHTIEKNGIYTIFEKNRLVSVRQGAFRILCLSKEA